LSGNEEGFGGDEVGVVWIGSLDSVETTRQGFAESLAKTIFGPVYRPASPTLWELEQVGTKLEFSEW